VSERRTCVECDIESIAAGGDGVGHEASGRVVFVPRTAPGDRVVAELVQSRKSFARGVVERLVRPAAVRVVPLCPHYRTCGGCQLQHVDAGVGREAKRSILRDALARIGGVELTVPPVVPAEAELGYRNRLTFTLRRATDGTVRAGFHRFDRRAELVDVSACPLAEEPIRLAWRSLRAGWGKRASALPAGRELRLTLRTSVEGRLGLLISGGVPERPGRPEKIASLLGSGVSFHWLDGAGRRERLAGPERLKERWQGLALELGPETFLQVNRTMAATIDRYIEERIGSLADVVVWDLYAGVGARAIRWALSGAEVSACEIDAEAVASGREAAARVGVAPDLRSGPVEKVLPSLSAADWMVLNPPRGGLSLTAARWVELADVRRLVYISCDPATLARDLGRLSSHWRVVEIQAFDAFPQTAHVESVAWCDRR